MGDLEVHREFLRRRPPLIVYTLHKDPINNSYADAAGANKSPGALIKESKHIGRVLSGDAWLAESASAFPHYRKRAKFTSIDSVMIYQSNQ